MEVSFHLNRKDFPMEYCVGLQKTWAVCTSSKTANDIIAAQFAAQVEKAHQLQGEGSCKQKGVACKVFTGSALGKDESSLEMLVHNKEVRFLICFWKAGGHRSPASEEVRMNSSAKQTRACSLLPN